MEHTPPHRFVLMAIDLELRSVVQQKSFDVANLADLCALLDADRDELEGQCFEVDQELPNDLKQRFRIDFEPGAHLVELRSWAWIDDLPYEVHTNRELALMLKGTKPLAVFSDAIPDAYREEIISERAFEPYVTSGRMVKREVISAPPPGSKEPAVRRVLYALPHEQWRIDAYLLLWKTFEKSGWNDGFERMEGSLLGYEDWQNDTYMKLHTEHAAKIRAAKKNDRAD